MGEIPSLIKTDILGRAAEFRNKAGVAIEGIEYHHVIIDFGGATLLGALKIAKQNPNSAVIVIDPEEQKMRDLISGKYDYTDIVARDNNALNELSAVLNEEFWRMISNGISKNILLFSPLIEDTFCADTVICNYPIPAKMPAGVIIPDSARYLKKSSPTSIKVKTESAFWLDGLAQNTRNLGVEIISQSFKRYGFEDGVLIDNNQLGDYASLYDIFMSYRAREYLKQNTVTTNSTALNIYDVEVSIASRD